MTLSCLANNFTHYDLHTGNVLMYAPVKGKYIEYHYHKDNEEIIFKSAYIAKIIDYGRCFFKDPTSDTILSSSENIYNAICNATDCKEDCGYKKGYRWLSCNNLIGNAYICSKKRNKSHDLRLLYILKHNFPHIPFFKKVRYCEGYTLGKPCKGAGTIENTRSGLPDRINNVHDAHEELLRLIRKPEWITNNDTFYNNPNKKLGELHIYYDGRPLEFIENKS
jgi:hypothetical protein